MHPSFKPKPGSLDVLFAFPAQRQQLQKPDRRGRSVSSRHLCRSLLGTRHATTPYWTLRRSWVEKLLCRAVLHLCWLTTVPPCQLLTSSAVNLTAIICSPPLMRNDARLESLIPRLRFEETSLINLLFSSVFLWYFPTYSCFCVHQLDLRHLEGEVLF